MLVVWFVTVILAYLVGSVPTGYLMGRAKGIDLRSQGSGNIGATNALRILGKPAGIFVLLVDALKGWAAVFVVPHLARSVVAGLGWGSSSDPADHGLGLAIAGGVFAVLGHNFTCWLRFKGGKGIATSAGVLAALLPMPFVVVLFTFLVVLTVSRIVSLASVSAAAVLPLATIYWHRQPGVVAFSLVLSALAIWRHRANLRRLREGTEPRIGQRPKVASPDSLRS